jgi:glutamyl-Q tRNA(Asp) synthetase
MTHDGRWHLRIEDLDPPREIPGASSAIVSTLQALGFEWHGEVDFQSRHAAQYQVALDFLVAQQRAYPCGCTRAEIALASHGSTTDGEAIYPGICAHGLPAGKAARSWRLRMRDETTCFNDRWLGPQCENTARETGDIVLKRADGFWAYQLAVVVDDIATGVTHVVRGDDLLHNTARQIVLYAALGASAPAYLHVPVVRNAQGEKLSKQTLAPAIETSSPLDALRLAALHLGLDLDAVTVAQFWSLAPQAWEKVRALRVREPHLAR